MLSSNGHGYRTRNGNVVSQDTIEGRAVRKRKVAHASNPLGNRAAIRLGIFGKDGVTNANATRREGAVGSPPGGVRVELDVEARGCEGGDVFMPIGYGECGEGLDDEGRAVGTGGDKRCGEGENRAEAEGGVKGLGDGGAGREEAEGGLCLLYTSDAADERINV